VLLVTQNGQPTLEFTQGDNASLLLQATDDLGNPQNLTGATFSTQILGANGVGPVTFGNSQHTINNAALGQFTLALANTDTPNCGIGTAKEIITTVTISGVVTNYRGVGILSVFPNVPLQ
jgi:hypothetical protein